MEVVDIHIHIHSLGGDASEGLTIHEKEDFREHADQTELYKKL